MDEALRRLQRQISDQERGALSGEISQYLTALERYANLYESRFGHANAVLYLAEPEEFSRDLRDHLGNFAHVWDDDEEDPDPPFIFEDAEHSFLIPLTDPVFIRIGEGYNPVAARRYFNEPDQSRSRRTVLLREEWVELITLLQEVRDDGFAYLFLDLSRLTLNIPVFHGPIQASPLISDLLGLLGGDRHSPQLGGSPLSEWQRTGIVGAQTPPITFGLAERLEDELLQQQICSEPECPNVAINLDYEPIEHTNYPLRCDVHINYCDTCLIPDHPVCGTLDPHGIAETTCPCCFVEEDVARHY